MTDREKLENTLKTSTRKAYWDSLIAQLKANNERLKNLPELEEKDS